MSGAVGGEAMSLSEVLTIAKAWPVPSPSSALMFRWSSGHFVVAQSTLEVHVWSPAVSACTAKRNSVAAWLLQRTPTLPPVAMSVEMSSGSRLFAFGAGRTKGVTKSVSVATVWGRNTERPPRAAGRGLRRALGAARPAPPPPPPAARVGGGPGHPQPADAVAFEHGGL